MTDTHRDDTHLDLAALDALAEDGARPRLTAQQRELLAAAFVFTKTALIYELNNPTMHAACDRIAAIANAFLAEHGSAALELVGDGAYVNRDLVKLDAGGFEQAEYLQHVWAAVGVGRIEATDVTDRERWLEAARQFRDHLRGHADGDMTRVSVPGIRFDPPPEEGHGESLEVTDRFRALRAYSLASVALESIIDSIRTGARARVVDAKRPLQELIDVGDACAALMMSLVHLKRHKSGVHHHLTNTAVLTIAMTHSLGMSRSHRSELALQAALHDLGRAFVPAGRTGDADRRAALESVCKLVRAGVRDARMIGRAAVAAEVGGAAEGEPSAASRLIAVAHAYDLLTTPTADRPALLPDEALRVLMAESGRRYDPVAVKLLVNRVGVYPIGSLVALSDGRAALVVEAPRDATGPDRPRVKVVREADGRTVDGAVLDLAGPAGANLSIVRCLDADDEQLNAPAFLLG
ncbi:MAG: hypothetical protein D6689_03120 [Deltaproteobacteria bacterium]|nr:MAG: hypothetical protein D6689_03120 [Deltaproteobacteria bacterium]